MSASAKDFALELNREQRMEMTKCPISIAAVFLVLPPQPLP